MQADAVEVGRVMGAWGIKGGIKVKAFAADAQALFSSKCWFLRPPEVAGPRGPKTAALPPMLTVLTAKEQGDGVVATAQELPDRSAAEALRGARIFVSRANFPKPDEGEFYWVDLIGLAVANRQGRPMGEVVGLIETGPHCVLRIQPADSATSELLIPFVDAYVDSVDLPGRHIGVDWDHDETPDDTSGDTSDDTSDATD